MAQRAEKYGVFGRNEHWFRRKPGEDVHDLLVPFVTTLAKTSSGMHQKNRARERIYEGEALTNMRGAVALLDTYGTGIAQLNATKSIIDTFTSRLAKDRPMPWVDTTGQTYDIKQRGKDYRAYIVGKMEDTEYDELSRECLLDAGILGNGFTRIDDDDDDVFAERVQVNEMIFDKRECRYGRPQTGYRVTRVARDYLLEIYPGADMRCAIEESAPSLRRSDDDSDMGLDFQDYVDVYEAHRLPSTSDSEDGRHVICCEKGTLLSEKWIEKRFPWAHLRLFKPRVGFWGLGFVDQLARLQDRVNKIVRDIQLNLAASGRGHFLVNEQNDISVGELTGFAPFKLKFKGPQAPVWSAPQPLHPAQLDALKFFIEQMFDLTGVSKAAATSKSSLGAGASGIALDTQYDIDSDRFRLPQSNYAGYRLTGAQCFADAACRVARWRESQKGKKRSSVAWRDRDEIARLEYDKVSLKNGQYKLRIQAQNFIPDEKAGKLAIVEQLSKAGVFPQWIVPMLFDEPDIAEANNLVLAPIRNALKKMDKLLDPRKPAPYPDPAYNDLDLELKIVLAYLNWMEEEEAPDEIMQRLRDYKDAVVAAVAMKTQPDPNAPPAPPMSPAEQPLPGGVPPMPQGPVPAPTPIGAPPMMPPAGAM
jgi:hypothetical protein